LVALLELAVSSRIDPILGLPPLLGRAPASIALLFGSPASALTGDCTFRRLLTFRVTDSRGRVAEHGVRSELVFGARVL
jgi:hypothetical protein